MSKKRTQPHDRHGKSISAGDHGKGEHGHGPGHEQPTDHDDDLIAVPKGETRIRFYMKLGLMIFLLIIFVVPGALMDSLSPGAQRTGGTYVAWESPDGERRELDYSDFVQRKREMLYLDDTNPGFEQFRGRGNLALLGMGDFDPKEELDTVRFMILEELAYHEGIRTTPGELADAILNLFGGAETYHAVMRARRSYLSAVEFENVLSRALAVRRFLGYLAVGAAAADPEAVVKRWRAEHQEYAFDYVQVACADFAEEVRADLPADEELQAWFEGLGQGRKSKYNTQPRWSAEFVQVPLGEDAAADASYEALLAKYPRPEDSDPDELALQYYNNFKFFRFKRPEPLTEEQEPDPQLRQFLAFEDVAEDARREAPIYYALEDFLSELNERVTAAAEQATGEATEEPETPSEAEPIDLSAEAAALGLAHVETSAPRSNAEWREAEMPWGGTESRIVARMSGVAEGRLTPSVYVDERVMAIARVVAKVPPGLPEFAEISEQVAEDWVVEHQAAKALEKLELLRDRLGERPAPPEDATLPPPPFEPVVTAEAFAQAAAELGFEVRRREYAERQQPGMPAEGDAPIETLLRFDPLFFSVDEGVVPQAKKDFMNEHAFVVRYVGVRDPEVSSMKPADLETIRNELESQAVQSFFASTFGSKAFLVERFKLSMRDPNAPEPQQ